MRNESCSQTCGKERDAFVTYLSTFKATKTLAVIAIFFLQLVVGCSKSNVTQNTIPPAAQPAVRRYQEAKLLVQKGPKGKTGVYHKHLKISSPMIVSNGQAVEGHSLELTNTAEFKGAKPKCVSASAALQIIHSTPSQAGWHFPPDAQFAFVADGETFKPVKVIQSSLELEDREYWESLTIQPTCEIYAKVSKAVTVEIRIGDASITLTPDEITDYKRFTTAIGFK